METVAGLVKDDRGRGLKHLFRHLDTGREFRMRGDHGLNFTRGLPEAFRSAAFT